MNGLEAYKISPQYKLFDDFLMVRPNCIFETFIINEVKKEIDVDRNEPHEELFGNALMVALCSCPII